jgi:hypothetical protein
MKQKEHLNNEGFARILKIRSSMNKKRVHGSNSEEDSSK